MGSSYSYGKQAVFALTHLPEARDKYNWFQTCENYERICLNKYFLNFTFGQVLGGKKN